VLRDKIARRATAGRRSANGGGHSAKVDAARTIVADSAVGMGTIKFARAQHEDLRRDDRGHGGE
jgi:hypothetical protein